MSVDRRDVGYLRLGGPEDVPIAETPPSSRRTRIAWGSEDIDVEWGDDPAAREVTEVATGLFSVHWEGLSPHRDYGHGPRRVPLAEAVEWSLQHACRLRLRVARQGEFTFGEDPAPGLPDGSTLQPPSRRVLPAR